MSGDRALASDLRMLARMVERDDTTASAVRLMLNEAWVWPTHVGSRGDDRTALGLAAVHAFDSIGAVMDICDGPSGGSMCVSARLAAVTVRMVFPKDTVDVAAVASAVAEIAVAWGWRDGVSVHL